MNYSTISLRDIEGSGGPTDELTAYKGLSLSFPRYIPYFPSSLSAAAVVTDRRRHSPFLSNTIFPLLSAESSSLQIVTLNDKMTAKDMRENLNV